MKNQINETETNERINRLIEEYEEFHGQIEVVQVDSKLNPIYFVNPNQFI